MRHKPLRRKEVSMRKLILLVLLALSCAQAANGPFQDGDRVCFVGDSITSGGGYHAYVQLFYATRYPTRELTYFNCGHSGGSAGECYRDSSRRLDGGALHIKDEVRPRAEI